MEGDLKIVYFSEYCKTCKHWKKKETDDPCFDCVAEGGNVDSHKPVNWEEKE